MAKKLLCKLGYHNWEILERRLSQSVFEEMVRKGLLSRDFINRINEDGGIKYQTYVSRKVCLAKDCGIVVDEITEFKDFVLAKQQALHDRIVAAQKIWFRYSGVSLIDYNEPVKGDADFKKEVIIDPYQEDKLDEELI